MRDPGSEVVPGAHMQVPHIPVTTFSYTTIFLFHFTGRLMGSLCATSHFHLTDGHSCRPELTHFARKEA